MKHKAPRKRSRTGVEGGELKKAVQKRIAEILHQQKFIQSVIKNAGVLILGFSPKGKILISNDELERLTGYTAEEVGKSFGELLQRLLPDPDHLGRIQKVNEKFWQGHNIENLETQITTKDGQLRFLLINQSLVKDESSQPMMAIMVARDITMRKAIEQKLIETGEKLADLNERLAQTNQQLEQANRRLSELATTDELTGLYNRREFQRTFKREVQRMKRDRTPLALAMLDVDHFKLLNDTHGHSFGDRVLAEVADLLKTEARVTDIVARYGGEEFTVLMPNTGYAEAFGAAERLRRRMAQRTISDGKQSTRVTISIGVAAVGPDEATSAETLLGQADEAMYAAKRSGRNCVVSHNQLG